MTHIPYNKEAIIAYLTQLIPDQGGDVESWVTAEFARFEEKRRKLPKTITVSTLKSNWASQYKNRGRTDVRFDRCRVIRNSSGL